MQSTARAQIVLINQNVQPPREELRFSQDGAVAYMSQQFKEYLLDDFRNRIPIPPNTIEGLKDKQVVMVATESATFSDQQLFARAFTQIFFPRYLQGHGYVFENKPIQVL